MSKKGPTTNKAPAQKRAKNLNVKAALKEDSLLTGVTLADLQVTLQLAATYNQASDYQSINYTLYKLYQISAAFQASFEVPKQGTHTPILQLKENHGYADENAILNALKAFVTPQKRLKVKVALSDGSLLTGVTLAGLQVTLQLAAAYNQASDYLSINDALYKLYQISPAFQASFEAPKQGAHVPILQLKENHGYVDEYAILSALKAFAAPEKRLKIRAALNDGSLLTGATLAGLQVTLKLAAAYNQVSDYQSINQALYGLYQTSLAFQATFEPPKMGTSTPVLQLKENHGYTNENAILSALKAFAVPKKRLNAKAALRDGSLLTGVTLAGLQVTLQLAAAYNQASDYKSINKALYGLYKISPAFQTTFERLKLGINVPVLRLKENHSYADENAILNALKAFAMPQKRLNVKAALKEGSLLTGATLAGLQVTLQLAAAYNQARDYQSINQALYHIHQMSPAFQVTFETPIQGTQAPVLRLKENHGYADGEAILAALIGFAQDKKDKSLSENSSSKVVDIIEPMPTIPDTLLIEAFPQVMGNFLINSSECDLLALLGEQLSDNQQSYLEVSTPSMSLTIENAPPPFQPLREVDLEAKKVAKTVQEILGEDNDPDYDIEKDIPNTLQDAKHDLKCDPTRWGLSGGESRFSP